MAFQINTSVCLTGTPRNTLKASSIAPHLAYISTREVRKFKVNGSPLSIK
uniref:Uncharacterized protein n=1 Tax=Rhizophora mucronata TaxID=61149 RepID=A0A2P2N0B4_RHIMU